MDVIAFDNGFLSLPAVRSVGYNRRMNSLDFDQLKQQIAKRLSEKGPATSEAIAHELGAPHGNVQKVA